ncbi:type I-E CRISPR-associated protein Cse2/CasB [Quadrisphaera sp. DSM 44207]|uniref:type I-E CRISPR-associated protein Cse2/CasB n=1 Tax=Quadrisphaera sp. DSM 44207 TaxID=1881057 RepID=UPI0008830D49|nr:type I-E CRISPR-associated protein Cse2/CasB [Quadrisphaera sp. DSM 44207]SDQ03922.1 CRISPR system Cascade subunit CasB [Quadrisphaera sp. DSM 44207]
MSDPTPQSQPSPSARPPGFAEDFVAYLRRVCMDPGARAALRRAARRRPAEAITAHRYLAAWVGESSSAHREAVLYQTAAWVATYDRAPHTDGSRGSRLGQALAAAVRGGGGTRIAETSAETRLMAAGRAPGDALLYQHLPQILSAVTAAGQRIDFAALTRDLFRWPTRSAEISKRWMSDFYRDLQPADLNAPVTASTTVTSG